MENESTSPTSAQESLLTTDASNALNVNEIEVDAEVITIGNYTPKRKFLSFVSAVNGAKIRYIRDTAFVKGEKLSGMLEGAIFKITICDEGRDRCHRIRTEVRGVEHRVRGHRRKEMLS